MGERRRKGRGELGHPSFGTSRLAIRAQLLLLPPNDNSLRSTESRSRPPSTSYGSESPAMANAVASSSTAAPSSSRGTAPPPPSSSPTEALRPLYEESSQYRNWRYSKEQLAKMRKDLNERAVDVVRKNLQAEKVSSNSQHLSFPPLLSELTISSPSSLSPLS